MNKKYSIHMVTNILIPSIAFAILIVAAYVMSIYANDPKFNLAAIMFLVVIAIISFVMHVFVIGVLNHLKFDEDKIILCAALRKNKYFKYNEYVWTIGIYRSVLMRRKILIFTPKDERQLFTVIDTTKQGNCNYANKNNILYCFYDEDLLSYLKTKTNFTYIDNK